MKYLSIIVVLGSLLLGCDSPAQKSKERPLPFEIVKTDAQWRAELSPVAYNVMRKKGTERAFSSELNRNNSPGVYVCAACGTPLYMSEHKFDSGTGWPSFDRAVEGNVVSKGKQMGLAIREGQCANCGGHLGHIFDDGPIETTGKRHCINGVALKFIPKDEESK